MALQREIRCFDGCCQSHTAPLQVEVIRKRTDENVLMNGEWERKERYAIPEIMLDSSVAVPESGERGRGKVLIDMGM